MAIIAVVVLALGSVLFCTGLLSVAFATNSQEGPNEIGLAQYEVHAVRLADFVIPKVKPEVLAELPGRDPRPDKKNFAFYERYLRPLAEQVLQADLPLQGQINLYAWLVVQTHQANGIGYLWGGDMLDMDPDPGSLGGVGYDCSGYIHAVYGAILPDSVFTDQNFRINGRDYLELGREIIPPAAVDEAFIETICREGQPGDVLIDPEGHISLFGSRPENEIPLVMENGYSFLELEAWLRKYRGQHYTLRRAFDENGLPVPARCTPFEGKVLGTADIATSLGVFQIALPPDYVRRDLARSRRWNTRRNRLFYDLYLKGILPQVTGQGFPLDVQASLVGRLFYETLQKAGVSKCPNGDIAETSPKYQAGVGFDDAGFPWSVACALEVTHAGHGDPSRGPERWRMQELKSLGRLVETLDQVAPGAVVFVGDDEAWLHCAGGPQGQGIFIRAGVDALEASRLEVRAAGRPIRLVPFEDLPRIRP